MKLSIKVVDKSIDQLLIRQMHSSVNESTKKTSKSLE